MKGYILCPSTWSLTDWPLRNASAASAKKLFGTISFLMLTLQKRFGMTDVQQLHLASIPNDIQELVQVLG
jgi:hypothetical protein